MRVVILGSGRGSNAEAILQAQQAGRLGRARVVAIFADQPAAGILALGARFGVPAQFVDPAPFKTKLERRGRAALHRGRRAPRRPISWCSPGFMRVLKPGFLDGVRRARSSTCTPACCPSFPGLDGIGQAWRRGVKITGCTVHYVDAEVDGGPIIDQAAVRIEPDDTLESLAAKIHAAEHALLPAVIARLSLAGEIG